MSEMPDTIYNECPDCGDVTEHKILKAKMGNFNVNGTFQCKECGRVFSGVIRLPKEFEVKVLLSDGDLTETTQTMLREDEIVAVGDEFDLDDGRHVQITYIELPDGSRKKKVPATEVKALWVKAFGVLMVKVSVNDYKKTYPMLCEAEPDDEFTVGMFMHFDLWDCVIHAIKTKDRLLRKGTAEARDIVRIYAKIRHRDGTTAPMDDSEFDDEQFEFADDAVMDFEE
ncbi:MAG: hypothetical protein II805_03300 [Candidatus Methanomethylophilus sp.]|nr:hypothetical protein [Methanomethylophilus sp.]MBQ4368781.1 hypothetical protein [Methanomethylophilus sp.]MBQ4412053.1 hypothetical protein [Methanomethylophilus sp.]MBQ5483443.1 hypothetical protein [Methanomethylophilus sp.]MBR2254979.1 hypothetical protein [Candidatus Methanomethylophilaceae archaeon]